jgi:hypothetical protein
MAVHTIASVPATFTNTDMSLNTAVSFAIPAGTWTSAYWSYTATLSGTSTAPRVVIGAHTVTFPTTPSAGSNSDTVNATANQVSDIQAAQGGSLAVTFNNPAMSSGASFAVAVFTLTITGTDASVPSEYDIISISAKDSDGASVSRSRVEMNP